MSAKSFSARELYEFYLSWVESDHSLEPYSFAEFKKLLPSRK